MLKEYCANNDVIGQPTHQAGTPDLTQSPKKKNDKLKLFFVFILVFFLVSTALVVLSGRLSFLGDAHNEVAKTHVNDSSASLMIPSLVDEPVSAASTMPVVVLNDEPLPHDVVQLSEKPKPDDVFQPSAEPKPALADDASPKDDKRHENTQDAVQCGGDIEQRLEVLRKNESNLAEREANFAKRVAQQKDEIANKMAKIKSSEREIKKREDDVAKKEAQLTWILTGEKQEIK